MDGSADAGFPVLIAAWGPTSFGALVVLACGLALLLWMRERAAAAQRRRLRGLNILAEDMITARSPDQILEKLKAGLLRTTGVSAVRLFLFNRVSRSLEAVGALAPPAAQETAELCFRNRALLSIPDTRRAALVKAERGQALARSVLFIPMTSNNETVGVLEIDHARGARLFSRDEQAASQHLGNQVAIALKLLEQQSIREQLFRSEKLAAAGQLISGIASELRVPLEAIKDLASRSIAAVPATADLERIAAEADRASAILARLVSFARPDQAEAHAVDLAALLAGLIEFREREWASRGIEVRPDLPSEPLPVSGSESQLEQVFLNLLVHAEQSMAPDAQRSVGLRAGISGQSVLVEISYPGPAEKVQRDPFGDGGRAEAGALGLEVCRGVLQGHGGEIHLAAGPGAACRFEVRLPLAGEPQAVNLAGPPSRTLTVLLLEPDLAPQRRLLTLLSSRGHRVVPAGSPEEALDVLPRLAFDVVCCSVRLPSMNWIAFRQAARPHARAFVLLTEGHDPELARTLARGDDFILAKPIQESEFDPLMAAIEAPRARPVSQ